MSTPLHIIRLVLHRRELARFARRHHLGRNVDDGYLLHAGLAQLFATSHQPAKIPLHTFAVDDTLERARRQPEFMFLLGYSDLDHLAMIGRMGSPKQWLVHTCDSRNVPVFPAGARAEFRVRACPIVRTRTPVASGPGTNGDGRGRIRELDAWLASLERGRSDADDPHAEPPFANSARVWSGREAAYGGWLEAEFARHGGAVLDGPPRLATFKRDRLYRRSADSGRVLERPNAILEGRLRVGEPDSFRAFLRRGLGRHRAFGFGMLLLRPGGG